MAHTPAYIQSRLRYDGAANELVWLPIEVRSEYSRTDKAWNTKHAGKIAGTSISPSGYRELRVNGKLYRYHVVLWAVLYGEWCSGIIDHADRNTLNNNPANLRKATRSQNNANAKIRTDNISGFKGVQFHRQTGKWRARIRQNGSQRHIGLFNTPHEASKAYEHNARKLFGEFASIGG